MTLLWRYILFKFCSLRFWKVNLMTQLNFDSIKGASVWRPAMLRLQRFWRKTGCCCRMSLNKIYIYDYVLTLNFQVGPYTCYTFIHCILLHCQRFDDVLDCVIIDVQVKGCYEFQKLNYMWCFVELAWLDLFLCNMLIVNDRF